MKFKQSLTMLFISFVIGTLVIFVGDFSLSAYKINSYRSAMSAQVPNYERMYFFLLLMLCSSVFSLFGAFVSLMKTRISLALLIFALAIKIGLVASYSFIESELIVELLEGKMPLLILGGIFDTFFIARIFLKI